MTVGYPRILLRTQYRMHPDIGEMDSEIIYDGQSIHHPSTKFQPGVKEGRDFHQVEFQIASQLVFVDLPSSVERQTYTQSKVNVYHSNFIMILACRMIDMGIPPECIAVCNPHEGQWKVYRAAVATFRKHIPQHGATKIRLEKVDSIMGREFRHVILDLLNTRDIGFMAKPGRLNVSLSRGKASLTIVANPGKIANNSDNTAWFRRVFSYCNTRKWVTKHSGNLERLETFIAVLPRPEQGKEYKDDFSPFQPKDADTGKAGLEADTGEAGSDENAGSDA